MKTYLVVRVMIPCYLWQKIREDHLLICSLPVYFLSVLTPFQGFENCHLRLPPTSNFPFYPRCSDRSLPAALLFSTEPAGLHEVQDFLGRIQFHQYLGKHPNLVQLDGCCTEREPLYMVLEDVAQGDLLSFLWTCRRVSSGMEVLERKGFTWLISCSHVN